MTYKQTKRILDIVIATFVIILTSPIMLITSILIEQILNMEPLFVQPRVGKDNKLFNLYKFQTYKDGDTTKFTRFLRKYRIDELPQMFNVLKGDMSLIGPRPEQPHAFEQHKRVYFNAKARNHVKPGITGLAQVNQSGKESWTNLEKKYAYDYKYVVCMGFKMDICIFFKTFLTIIKGTGI